MNALAVTYESPIFAGRARIPDHRKQTTDAPDGDVAKTVLRGLS